MLFIGRRLPVLILHYKCTVCLIVAIFIAIFYFLINWNLVCTNIQAYRHVTKVCDLYKKEKAIGSLCRSLCETNDITSLTCHSFRTPKDAVFSARWRDKKLVFKTAATNQKTIHWYDNNIKKYPTERQFVATIRNMVKNKFNITLSINHSVKLGRLEPTYEENDVSLRQKEIDNIWALLHNNEYLVASVFEDRDVFPQILGTCGNYFAVEYLENVPDAPTIWQMENSKAGWGKKLRLGIQILNFLSDLEENFHEAIHLCEIKLPHFGIAPLSQKLKFMDLNSVYTKSYLNKLFQAIPACTKNEDCEIYDCRSFCNEDTGKCGAVTNNNLQVVCEKLFLGLRMSNSVIVPGLLVSEYTPSSLAVVLRQCANSWDGLERSRSIPNLETKKRLYDILIEIEQSVNSDLYLTN